MVNYILYKHPIELDSLAIVQYMYSLGYDLRPKRIVERNHPIDVCILPCIHDLSNNKYYRGMREIICFYENCFSIKSNDLLEKALIFKKNNPDYRINQ